MSEVMDRTCVNTVSETRMFARTILYNIHVYYVKKAKGDPTKREYKACKLYSNYCHAVILHYLESNDGIFSEVEMGYLEIVGNTDLKESTEANFNEWQSIGDHPSHSEWYIYFAKSAILATVGYLADVYEEKVTKCADNLLEKRVLSENYDISRIQRKGLVDAIYKQFRKDLVQFLTKVDKDHGLNEQNVSQFAADYLYENSKHLLSTWKKLESHKEMNKSKFYTLINQMYDSSKNLTKDEKVIFMLNAALLSLYSCIYCEFPHAAELIVDILMYVYDGKVL